MANSGSLTGVWHGLYTYATQPHIPESHFVCVLIDSGGRLSGTIHEKMNHYRRAATQENATLEGVCHAGGVEFVKTYDGSGGNSHSVSYSGRVNATGDEIEGTWKIPGLLRSVTGHFLMIRNRSAEQPQCMEAGAHRDRQSVLTH